MFLELDKKAAAQLAAEDIRGRKISYGELAAYIKNFQGTVTGRGPVLILCRNDLPTLMVYLACMAGRIVPLLIGEKTESESFCGLLKAYGFSHVFGYREVLERLGFEKSREAVEGSDYAVAETGQQSPPLYEELSLLLTTSGSTGSPKLVRHSYDNLEKQAKNIASFFEMDGAERPMIDLPIMYTYGLSVVNSHLYAGATLLLSDESILSRNFWKFFKEKGATSFTGVPYSYELLKRLRFFSMELPELKLLSQGGGKLSEELQKEFARYILDRGGRYIATYGQTECSARMSYLPSELALEKCGSIGKAIPEGKLYLKDEQGQEIRKAGQEGELYYEGPNVTLGYAVSGEDLIRGDERGGVIATGDLAYMDEEGYFYITGRRKRFLKLFGYRVSLDECESLVKNAFHIDCACTGNDKKLKVCILDEAYREKVKDFLIKKTSLYATAVEVYVMKELPRNAAGKLLYQELEKQLKEKEGKPGADA